MNFQILKLQKQRSIIILYFAILGSFVILLINTKRKYIILFLKVLAVSWLLRLRLYNRC